tara:strand:+ start:475 stop:2058 length:1584 start_codon:yes stop_codon:yes gene_type:complete
LSTIGRGTWIDKLTNDIIKREKELERSTEKIIVESGLGASGIPHIGSLGDAVRAYGVKMALEDSGYKSELIAYSDDMDGLRKIPEGFPDTLKEELGKPVSSIEDPFGCHSSYGQHMSSLLLNGLDKLNIEYNFKSATEIYQEGILKEQTSKILKNSEIIGKKIAEITGQTKFEKLLPYYPICGNCKKIYVTIPTEFNENNDSLNYICNDVEIGGNLIKGCNYEGETKLSEGKGKLGWKVEFAARWSALDIRFEAYGKDIEDSVKINDWISGNILDHPHPFHIRYEMFLDKSGKKISKSIGNVLTPQKWLEYGTPESLLLLMFKRIAGARALSVEDIPTYMDEVDSVEDVYFDKVKSENKDKEIRIKGLYEYMNHLNPPEKESIHLPYRLLVELAEIAPKNNSADYIAKKLIEYQYVKEIDDNIVNKINLGINWARDFKSESMTNVEVSEEHKKPLLEIITLLEKNSDPEVIQSEIFEIAKSNDMKPRALFQLIYQILLGSNKGPRLGKYIIDADKSTITKKIKAAIE